MPAYEEINDVETKSSAKFVTYLKVDDLIFLLEPTTEILNSYVHEECLRSSISIVSLPHLLLGTMRKSNIM